MKDKIGIVMVWLLLLGLTVVYVFIVSLGLDELAHRLNGFGAELPQPTVLLANSEYSGIWVVLAFLSLAASFVWWRVRAKNHDLPEPYLLPMLCHTLWIALCLLANVFGAILPFLCMCEPV